MNSKKINFVFLFLATIFCFSIAKKNIPVQIANISPATCVTNSTLNLSSTYSGLSFNNSIELISEFEAEQKLQDSKNPKFKYVIFDICKTFWKKSLYDLLYAYQKQKGVSFSYYLTMARFGISYSMGTLDPKEAYEAFLKFCRGTPLKDLKKNCLQIWQRECRDFIFKDAKKLFEKHKQEGATIILTESGFSELYDELCSVYKFDYCCVSELEIKDDKVTGKLVGEPCSGKEKLAQIKNLIEKKLKGSLQETIFYANSHNDIPLLEKVGRPVAVNPDPKLKSYAKKKGWQILKFS